MNWKYLIPVVVIWLVIYWYLHRPANVLSIIICDVGQGDGILTQLGNWQMLVDAGRDDKILTCLEEYMPFADHTLEVVLATHPDSDHIGGLPAVLEGYRVKTMITNGQQKESDDFKLLESVIQSKNQSDMQLIIGKNGVEVPVPQSPVQFNVKIIFPLEERCSERRVVEHFYETILSDVTTCKTSRLINYNDGSIALLLTYGKIISLYTGDLEESGEQALSTNHLLKDIDILKVGHHGAKTSTTRGFLEKVRPEISLISVGVGNSYGHPSPQVIDVLRQFSSHILRTDQSGTIVLQTDGQSVWQLRSAKNVKELISKAAFARSELLLKK